MRQRRPPDFAGAQSGLRLVGQHLAAVGEPQRLMPVRAQELADGSAKESSPGADAGAASDATKNGARGLPLGALASLAWPLSALPGLLALLARLLLAATALLTAAALLAALMLATLATLAALAALLAALVRIAHDRSCVRFARPTLFNGRDVEWFRQFPYHATG